jgi:hypothetical protein
MKAIGTKCSAKLKGKIMRINHKIGKSVSTMELILLKEWGWFESSHSHQNDVNSQYNLDCRMLGGLPHLSNKWMPDTADGLKQWLYNCCIEGF